MSTKSHPRIQMPHCLTTINTLKHKWKKIEAIHILLKELYKEKHICDFIYHCLEGHVRCFRYCTVTSSISWIFFCFEGTYMIFQCWRGICKIMSIISARYSQFTSLQITILHKYFAKLGFTDKNVKKKKREKKKMSTSQYRETFFKVNKLSAIHVTR